MLPSHSAKAWKIPKHYRVTELIGSGAYGSVVAAEDMTRNEMVAIKRCGHLFRDLVSCKRILREISILSKLQHKNVVRITDLVVPQDVAAFDEIYFAMEHVDSDLKHLCKQDVTLTSRHISTMMCHLFTGLEFIHSAGVYHRDLKPANVFVNENCTVKIGDFGLARAIGGEFSLEPHCVLHTPEEKLPQVPHTKRLTHALTGHVVTRWYRAPELILLQESYTEAIDYWSVGCIFAELLGMLEGTCTDVLDRGALFPGTTCFPLSPHHRHRADYKYHSQGKHDMLSKIFDIIGTPSEVEISSLDRDDARQYVTCFAKRPGSGFMPKFPHVGTVTLDLLAKLLKFSPSERITARGALEHPYLQDGPAVKSEMVAPEVVVLHFEKESELTESFLRQQFLHEIRKYHPEAIDKCHPEELAGVVATSSEVSAIRET